MYEYYEPNKHLKKYTKGKNKGKPKHANDCVVRAFSKAWGVDWTTAAKILFSYAFEIQRIPDEEDCWKSFLEPTNISQYTTRYGFRNGVEGYHKCYITVDEFAKSTKGTRTKYILNCPQHLVCVSNGKYYDSFNSGWLTVRKIFKVKPLKRKELQ